MSWATVSLNGAYEKKNKNYTYNPKEWDESKSVKVVPEKKVARKKGNIGYQTLMKLWIAERFEQEIA